MEQNELRAWEALCIQDEPPACRAGCPLNVDARSFTLAMRKGDIPGARAILEKAMPLPGLVARLCEAPCEQFCLRKDLGGSVALGLLERLCVANAPSRTRLLRLPPKPKTAAILGGGPSSLSAASFLAHKGYPVTLYTQNAEPGAWLRGLEESIVPSAVFTEEMARLKKLGVCFRPWEDLDSIPLPDFDDPSAGPELADAVYLGLDDILPAAWQENANALAHQQELNPITFALPASGWFCGGLSPEDHPYRFITDISQGREAGVSMDRYLQGASLTASRVLLRHGQTDLFTQTDHVIAQERIMPASGAGYTPEEGKQEAERCLDCQCLECVQHCAYLQHFDGYPKTFARRIYNNSAIVKGTHLANTLINSCSLCRQCEVLCPNDFSMADLCLDARKTMVKENRMPASAHWFALEEMHAARTEGALLCHAQGSDTSVRLFYPGCQLAGIRPEQTLGLYDLLRSQESRTGIWLDCCGAPASWSGRDTDFQAILDQMRASWQEMGQPEVITACSTCLQVFREHLPEITVRSVWVVLNEEQNFTSSLPTTHRVVAVSDPCTARQDESVQVAVRQLVQHAGCTDSPLAMSGELTECCGFGGLMENANPDVAAQVAQARVEQSDAELLTYCAMCRDQLARSGKPVSHILDLLFADLAQAADTPPQSISARRVQRKQLKKTLVARYPDAEQPEPNPWDTLELEISVEVGEMMEKRRILEDDLRQVLYGVEQGGTCFVHGESGQMIASAQLGQVTFWVQYSREQDDDPYCILRCWTHRMVIAGGQV